MLPDACMMVYMPCMISMRGTIGCCAALCIALASRCHWKINGLQGNGMHGLQQPVTFPIAVYASSMCCFDTHALICSSLVLYCRCMCNITTLHRHRASTVSATVTCAVLLQAVASNGRHWSQEWQYRPEAVINADVGCMHLFGAAGPESFSGIPSAP